MAGYSKTRILISDITILLSSDAISYSELSIRGYMHSILKLISPNQYHNSLE